MQEAFDEFQRLFICPICQQTLKNPHTVSECSHTFCADCILSVLGERCACPQCGTLARIKNCKPNPAQNNIIDLIEQLNDELRLFHDNQWSPEDSEECQSGGDGEEEMIDDAPADDISPSNQLSIPLASTTRRRKSAQMALDNVRTLYQHTADWCAPLPPSIKEKPAGRYRVSPDRRCTLVFSGVAASEQRLLEQRIGALHPPVQMEFRQEFGLETTTHLVVRCNEDTGLCGRTSKYLMAILGHLWIVRIDWLLEIISGGGEWVEESLFEVSGDTQAGRLYGPRKSREQAAGKLFDGFLFRLNGGDLYNDQELTTIIQCGGGSVLSATGSSCGRGNDGEKRLITLYQPQTSGRRRSRARADDSTEEERPVTWLYDCISAYKIIDL